MPPTTFCTLAPSFRLGQVMCEYDLHPIYFLLLLTSYIYIREFLCYYDHQTMPLLILLMTRVLLSFHLMLNSLTLVRSQQTHHNRHITIATDTATMLKNAEILSIQLAFKTSYCLNQNDQK